MATLSQLAAGGKLVKHEPELDRDEFPERSVYLAPEVEAWLDVTLRVAKRDRGRDLTPFEQVEQLLYEFVIGRPLVYDVQRKKLDPIIQHVWELKTQDVRLIGWFPHRRVFVVVCGRMKKEMPHAKLYAACILHTVWFRQTLSLDEPNIVTGVRYDDVL